MEILNLNKPLEINEAFCRTMGIKPVKGALINLDTNEIRYYETISSLYRKPVGWINIKSIIFKTPVYPNFLDPNNFTLLLEVQWQVFGCMDGQYKKIQNESFAVNYLYSKIRAIETLKCYGGSEMMDVYIDMVKDIHFSLEIDANDFN